jgi:hypothetical protein
MDEATKHSAFMSALTTEHFLLQTASSSTVSELSARRDLTLEWFASLQAPGKRLARFDNAAHSVVFEQFEQFGTLMRETVLPETSPGR